MEKQNEKKKGEKKGEKEKLEEKNLEEEIKRLKEELEKCKKSKEQCIQWWQRARADLLNYKKEEKERINEAIRYVKLEWFLKLLPILDNFEIAEKYLPQELLSDQNVKGLLLIKNQLKDFLKKEKVEEIETVGKKFNPYFHEVVEEVEIKEKESGIIIEEVQKGYKMGERVLRPAKVKVVK